MTQCHLGKRCRQHPRAGHICTLVSVPEHSQVDVVSLSVPPPHGQAGDQYPNLEPPPGKGGGQHPAGQRESGHPTPHRSSMMKMNAHLWVPEEASHLPGCEDSLPGTQPGQNQLSVGVPKCRRSENLSILEEQPWPSCAG